MTLRIIDSNATPSSIKIFFSDALDQTTTGANPEYSIQQLGSDSEPTALGLESSRTYDPIHNAIVITAAQAKKPWPLTKGKWVLVSIPSTIKSAADSPLEKGDNSFPVRVNGDDRDAERTTRAVEDAVSYPVLTEDVSFSAPTGRGTGSARGVSGVTSLGQVVTQAVGDVLGWKVKTDDAKGLVGALNASFSLKTVEGHTEATWTPRTYAVQTDLSGGISGAQASIYARAQGAVDQSLPLLDGLYKLDPEADDEDIAALKAVVGSQLRELVGELPRPGGPVVSRVNQYFQLLLGGNFPPSAGSILQTDPDLIAGTLGALRDKLGLNFTTQDFVNTLDDEQDLSNFRIMSDYVTSLAQSWLNNLRFFGLDTATPFFGTQLVLLSRQLSVVAESVDEVRFTLDSVFIGPAERQTLELHFTSSDQPLFAEDLFNWIADFSSSEGPRLIQEGGKFGVQNSFLPIATQLHGLVKAVHDPNPLNRHLPRGFHTSRVQRALRQLADQLEELVNLATPVTHAIVEEPSAVDLETMREEVAVLRAQVNALSPTPTRPPIVAFPPSLFFQPQRVNTASTPQIVTLFNSGISTLSIVSIAIDPASPNPKDFNLIEPQTFPVSLEPNATLAVLINFSPTDGGARSAKLSVVTSSATPLSISISGAGTI